MDYGEVLSRAWKIIWKHKILWVFGIFAGLVSQAGSGAGNHGGPRFQYSFDYEDFSRGVLPPQLEQFFSNAEHFFSTVPLWFWIVLGSSLFVLGIAFWILSIFGRAGLVRGSADADEEASLRFGSLFNKSAYYFGRLFLYDLLIFVCGLVLAVAIVLAVMVFGVATLGIGLICLIPFLCLLVPIGWVLGVYLTQVQVALVAEDLGLWGAFARAWKVVTSRLGEMVLMGLILFVIRLVVGILLALPFGLVIAPFIASFLTTGVITSGATTSSLIIGLVLLPFAILADGILEAYLLGAWTLTFRRLTGRKAGSPTELEPAAPVTPAAPEPPQVSETLPPQA